VPGNGTFNLTGLWRALGIKNPQPTIREVVQPVVLTADFSDLQPQHPPPMGSFGGDIGAVVAEFATLQVTSAAPGGCYIDQYFSGNQDLHYGIGPRIGGLFTIAPSGVYSPDPLLSIVEFGTDPVNIFTITTTPSTPAANRSVWPGAGRPFFIPAGQSFIAQFQTVNVAINNWAMLVRDVPNSENPAA